MFFSHCSCFHISEGIHHLLLYQSGTQWSPILRVDISSLYKEFLWFFKYCVGSGNKVKFSRNSMRWGHVKNTPLVFSSLPTPCQFQHLSNVWPLPGLLCLLTLSGFSTVSWDNFTNDEKMIVVMPNKFNMGIRHNPFGRTAEIQVNYALNSLTWICIQLRRFCGCVYRIILESFWFG